jgi:hypothetical protein
VLLGQLVGVFRIEDGEGEVRTSGEFAEVPTQSMHIPLLSPRDACTMYTL